MITAEQLKDVQQRVQALHRYLDIDSKKIEFEEEQLRTQVGQLRADAGAYRKKMLDLLDQQRAALNNAELF